MAGTKTKPFTIHFIGGHLDGETRRMKYLGSCVRNPCSIEFGEGGLCVTSEYYEYWDWNDAQTELWAEYDRTDTTEQKYDD